MCDNQTRHLKLLPTREWDSQSGLWSTKKKKKKDKQVEDEAKKKKRKRSQERQEKRS